jgi:ribosomal protein L37AE/L43A
MKQECTVCQKEYPQRNMKYLDPINDWICADCLSKGKKHGVTNLEDGKKLTKKIREEEQ